SRASSSRFAAARCCSAASCSSPRNPPVAWRSRYDCVTAPSKPHGVPASSSRVLGPNRREETSPDRRHPRRNHRRILRTVRPLRGRVRAQHRPRRRGRRRRGHHRRATSGRVTGTESVVGLVLSALVTVYLVYALLFPENL